MSIGTIILIILIIALLGGFSGIGGGPFYGTGYYGGGGLRLLIFLFLVFFLGPGRAGKRHRDGVASPPRQRGGLCRVARASFKRPCLDSGAARPRLGPFFL